MTEPNSLLIEKTQIRLVQGDITKVSGIQAIVNPANCTLLGGGGADGAIHRAAGPKLLEECRTLNGCRTGEAKITKAYLLPCQHVIHTPGPIWHGGMHQEAQLLSSCYKSCLTLAAQHKIRTIAFPSISTGVYSYPVRAAAENALCTVISFVKNNPEAFDLIEWVLFDSETFAAYEKALNQMQ